jgi:DnaJ-class molecular chaperone
MNDSENESSNHPEKIRMTMPDFSFKKCALCKKTQLHFEGQSYCRGCTEKLAKPSYVVLLCSNCYEPIGIRKKEPEDESKYVVKEGFFCKNCSSKSNF